MWAAREARQDRRFRRGIPPQVGSFASDLVPHLAGVTRLRAVQAQESGLPVKDYDTYLESLWHDYRAWCRQRGRPQSSIAPFSMSSIGKTRNARDCHPMLNAKAAQCKHVIPFLAELAIAAVERRGTEYARTRASCLRGS